MPRRPLLLSLTALALAACSSPDAHPDPLSPSTLNLSKGDVGAGGQAQAERPLTGRCETVLAPTQVLAPGVIRQVDSGTCRLSHLGRAEFFSDKVIQVVAGTQTTQATFTAANGDVLRATGSGTNVPSGPGHVRFTATLTFVGGTGRFAHATGQAFVEGESDLVARTATLTLEGRLAYDASDRSRH